MGKKGSNKTVLIKSCPIGAYAENTFTFSPPCIVPQREVTLHGNKNGNLGKGIIPKEGINQFN